MENSKENEVEIKSRMSRLPSRSPKRPLSAALSLNVFCGSPGKEGGEISGSMMSPFSGGASPVKGESSSPSRQQTLKSLSSMGKKLEKQYAELLVKYNSLFLENKQLEEELQRKQGLQQEQQSKLATYEKILNHLDKEQLKNKELWEKEVNYYKELIEGLQDRIAKLTDELKAAEDATELQVSVLNDAMNEKYNSLLKEFRVLQSNFELEKNSKLILIDQIEYLSKQNASRQNEVQSNSDIQDMLSVDSAHTVLHMNEGRHTLNELSDDTQSIDGLETERNGIEGSTKLPKVNSNFGLGLLERDDSQLFFSLADDLEDKLETSSPIKESERSTSIKVTSNFCFPSTRTDTPEALQSGGEESYQFPPSPDPELKELKRQSLPTRLIQKNNKLNTEDFILSPLKLASNSSYNNIDAKHKSITKRRYSNSKPNHSRYNSHDILPIKVEFEKNDSAARSASGPDKYQSLTSVLPSSSRFESIVELPESLEQGKKTLRDMAFDKLNGYLCGPSNRSSTTTTSSKKSSVYNDYSMLLNEGTKQEIMKLKFELQSLKLHNEKLLSYIGFELQKQKKNIKRLSHKRSKYHMEYSDAKLIEKSRDMLINKKRVLRSVSVNPVTSKRVSHGPDFMGIITRGIVPINTVGSPQNFYSNDTLSDTERNDEGFFGYGKSKTLPYRGDFPDRTNTYLNDVKPHAYLPAIDESRGIKKYQSQIFNTNTYDSTFDSIDECDDCKEDHLTNQDSLPWSDYSDEPSIQSEISQCPQKGILALIGSLFQPAHSRPTTRDRAVDPAGDGLKYKFLSIAIGIIIIGLRCSDYQLLHSSGH